MQSIDFHSFANVNQIRETIFKNVDLLSREFLTMTPDELLSFLRDLRSTLLMTPSDASEEIYAYMSRCNFERILVSVIDRNINKNIELLRESTWILLILFSKKENWLQRVTDCGVLPRFEKLLKIDDADLLENVR
jgi:hypothetical protein